MANPNKTAANFFERVERPVDPAREEERRARRRNPDLQEVMDDVAAGKLTPAEGAAKVEALLRRS